MAWTVETVEDLARALLTSNPTRDIIGCREDARAALAHLSAAGLLTSEACGDITMEYGYQIQRGNSGKWSATFRTGRDSEEAAKLGSRYATESLAKFQVTYRVVARVLHQGAWRKVSE